MENWRWSWAWGGLDTCIQRIFSSHLHSLSLGCSLHSKNCDFFYIVKWQRHDTLENYVFLSSSDFFLFLSSTLYICYMAILWMTQCRRHSSTHPSFNDRLITMTSKCIRIAALIHSSLSYFFLALKIHFFLHTRWRQFHIAARQMTAAAAWSADDHV